MRPARTQSLLLSIAAVCAFIPGYFAANIHGLPGVSAAHAAAQKVATYVHPKKASVAKYAVMVETAFREALRGKGFLDPELTLQGAPLAAKGVSLAAGAAMKQGKKALEEDLSPEKAIPKYQEAVRLYFKVGPYLTSVTNLVKAQLHLGIAYAVSGAKAKATAAFKQAVALDPSVRLQTVSSEKDKIQAFDAAKASLLGGTKGAVRINCRMPAAVYVNGKFRGIAPMTIRDVLPGRNILTVMRQGYRRWGTVVTITAGKTAKETAILRALGRKRPWETAGAAAAGVNHTKKSAAPAVLGFGTLTRSVQVVLAMVEFREGKIAVGAAAYNVATKQKIAHGGAFVDPSDADFYRIVGGLATGLLAGRTVKLGGWGPGGIRIKPKTGVGGGGKKPPRVKKGGVSPWVWVGVGAAVAAGAGVAAFFLLRGPSCSTGACLDITLK